MNISQFGISRKFFSDSFWSLFGNLVSVLAGLAAIKIITRLVAADDYGKASLVLGGVALLNSLLIGPLMVAHMRVYFDFIKREMALWYARMFNWVLGIAGVLSLLIYFLVAYIYNLRGNSIFLMLVVPAIVMIIVQPYLSAVTSYLEAHRLYRKLALVNILQKVFYPVILLLLLNSALSGAYSIVLSQGLAIIPLIILFHVIIEQKALNKKPDNDRDEVAKVKKSFTSFGWALPLGYLVHWVLSTSDRYLIEHFMTLKDVGVYAMNYGLWSIPFLMLNGWLEILTRPHVYRDAADHNWKNVKKILLFRTGFALIIIFIGTVLLYFFGKPIASIMLSGQYWLDKKLMMQIAIAHCFMVLGYSVFPVFLACKKTNMILIATFVGAIINISINIYAIPVYGITGAAASTLVSYIVWAGILVAGAHFTLNKLNEDAGHATT